MFANDVLKVLYAPHKVFKQITQNPKYWGPLLILILFVAAQSGFFYSTNLKTYYEQTSPSFDNLGAWTEDPGLWTTTQGAAISSNYIDYLNSSLYGNSSLQFSASNSSNLFFEIPSFNNVDCGPTGSENFSIRVKQVDPQVAPSTVTLTLYSLSSTNSFEYDLTSDFSNASLIGTWNNITIPVGEGSPNWSSNGNPQWGNITGLRVDFTYPTESTITLRVEGLFFRGTYATYTEMTTTGFVLNVLQLTLLQFAAQWLVLTGVLYILIKGMKGNVTWKPLFVAVGFTLVVMVVQALINIAVTTTLPVLHYPVEWYAGLPGEAAVITNAIATQTQTFSLITSIVQIAAYAWVVALNAVVLRILVPEFSATKSILASVAALILTILITSLLLGI